MTDKEIAWDLSEMFSGYDDPKITENIDDLLKDADEIVQEYKGKINKSSFTAQNLQDLIKKYEKILAGKEELKCFCWNLFNANTIVPENKALVNKYKNFESNVLKKLTFLS